MIQTIKRDWPSIISDLERAKLSPYKIALAVGLGHSKEIEAIRQGRIPRHHIGELLIALHDDLCPSGLSTPPIGVSKQ